MICPDCDGRGEVLDAPDNVLDGRAYWETCPTCHGRKEIMTPEELSKSDWDQLTSEERTEIMQRLEEDMIRRGYKIIKERIGGTEVHTIYRPDGSLLNVYERKIH